MNKYNPEIHHRRSVRLKGYDYAQAGLYFVTICVKNRACLFGEIVDEKMQLNECGEIADRILKELPKQFTDVLLDRFIVMPNHFHGIIEITGVQSDARRGAINRAPTTGNSINGGFANEQNPMLHNNLSRIVRWLKGRITFECRKINPCFSWQRNYHEHIIRNQKSHETIVEYILNNPARWETDCFYTK